MGNRFWRARPRLVVPALSILLVTACSSRTSPATPITIATSALGMTTAVTPASTTFLARRLSDNSSASTRSTSSSSRRGVASSSPTLLPVPTSPLQSWAPTAAQTALLVKVAKAEASSTQPSVTKGFTETVQPTDSWPINVRNVSYYVTTRGQAAAFVNGSPPPDDRNVFLLQMTGRFRVAISAPPGGTPFVTGTQIDAAIDGDSGDVLDFTMTNLPTVRHLPDNSKLLFER